MKKILYDYKIYIKRILQSKIYKYIYADFGKNSVIDTPLIIRNKKKIFIGDKVTIRANSRIEVVSEYNNTLYNPQLIIGDGTIIEFNLHITCAKNINIGKNVLIAGYVTIIDNNHGYYDIDIPIYKNDLVGLKETIIGDNSFIGTGSIVLPGTIIGRNCIIAANSVVSGNIPDYTMVAGAPSRIVKRYNFNKKSWERTDTRGNFIEE
ncbi:acyltransferase [Clostridium sp. UBA1652]|uniref:acyltransferase n=1 Tax=Clostridium sp. UBA1652 TaxID=1946348 RepID=UPI00257B379C|nr:acyltransferase [Clostridium sp. UBA1652]